MFSIVQNQNQGQNNGKGRTGMSRLLRERRGFRENLSWDTLPAPILCHSKKTSWWTYTTVGLRTPTSLTTSQVSWEILKNCHRFLRSWAQEKWNDETYEITRFCNSIDGTWVTEWAGAGTWNWGLSCTWLHTFFELVCWWSRWLRKIARSCAETRWIHPFPLISRILYQERD